MALVYIGAGSNLGSRYDYLRAAKKRLNESSEVKILRSSACYETEAVETPEHQQRYVNAVWETETKLSPRELLTFLQNVENEFGRERPYENAPRTLDLDILFYDREMINEPDLIIPHPRVHERYFALKPTCDLNPNIKHPKLDKYVSQLMKTYVDRENEKNSAAV